jgi:hypothetical protein
MGSLEKILHSEIESVEYSRIPHVVYLADFNTNHPNPSRIDRIASEINEYLKYKNRNATK